MRHKPVLLQEVLQGLNIPKGGVFIDCNLGDGGHTEAIIKSLKGEVTAIGFDLDQDAIDRALKNIAMSEAGRNVIDQGKLHLFQKNFRTLKNTLSDEGIVKISETEAADEDETGNSTEVVKPVADAILFDLGISSYEIDESGRGFSFQKDEPLLMTFGTSSDHTFTAYDIVNTWGEESIADIIYGYGEDKYSRRIAKAIVTEREARKKAVAFETGDKTKASADIEEGQGGIQTSSELAEIIKRAYPSFARFGKIHPATRTFQALRIAVNDELRALREALPQALEVLKPGGRLAVITFHSLEDRIVKHFFKENSESGKNSEDGGNGGPTLKLINKKPITPTEEEIEENPRSRSSKLRIVEKI